MSDPTEGENEERDVPASAVDERQHKKRETKKARQDREDREFFRHMIASEAGRRFMWSILASAHTFDEQFSFGPVGFPDPHETFFHLGEKMLGQRLYQTWHLREPELVMSLLRENDPRFMAVGS